MRVRTAQGVAPEHPGGLQVARVGELACDFRDPIGAGNALADAPELQFRRDAHNDAAAIRTASKIFAYPVQRQRFPDRASRMSSSLGYTLRASRSAVATTSPGVQKPHWTAPVATNASCTLCSRPSSANPSTVTISCPSA